jgi:hypothetical protein
MVASATVFPRSNVPRRFGARAVADGPCGYGAGRFGARA